MRLVSITLTDVRRFITPVRIAGIGPGLNVLSAPNENGKSTLFDALQALFFTPHRSKGKEIKSLRPHAGGAPEVAVEIDLPEGRFRLLKRWFAREVAEVWQADRLIAKADDAEAWISRLTEGAEGGPAGLLWVRQGFTRLDHDKSKDLEATKSARRDLMSSVTGEVETLTGGRRMDLALARAKADLDPLLTATGRTRVDGPLGRAEADVATLTKRQADLQAIANRLSTALDRRSQVRRTLADLTAPEAATSRKTRLAEATLARDQARQHAEAVASADTQVRMARLQRTNATSDLDALAKARADVAKARQTAAETSAQASTATASLAQANAKAETRLAAVHAARTARTAAETRLQAALRAEAARGAAARRHDLTQRLADLTTLNADLATARKAAALGPDPKALAALDHQLQEVAVQHRLRAASAARITMAYSGAQRVSLAGAPLAEGQATPILATAELDLPGLGRLTIHPGDGTASASRLDQAQADLATLLARLGYPAPEAAHAAGAGRAEAAAKVKDLESRLSALAPKGIAALQAELAALPDPVAEDPTLPSAPEAQQALDQAEHLRQQAEQAHESARQTAVQSRLAEAQALTNADTAAQNLAAAETVLLSCGDLSQAEATLTATLQAATRAQTDAETRHAALVAQAPDLAQAEAALARALSVAQSAEAEISALTAERAGLDTEIDLRFGEGVAEDLADVTARLAAAQSQRDRLLFEVAVLRDLIAALQAAQDTARERYFEPVMAELKPLLRLLWPDAELKFDGDSLLPVALIRHGLQEDIGILSGGTQEQIALFVRLAFARLLAKTGRHAPVILDDALVFTDDDRIETVFDALHGQANDLQIIVLSCRQRAFRDLGGQKLTFQPAGI